MAKMRYVRWEDDQAGGPSFGTLNFNPRWLLSIIPLVVILWLLSGIYIVRPEQQGVVRRFGKSVRVTEPGPHYHLPRPIERVDKVKVKRIFSCKIIAGFKKLYSCKRLAGFKKPVIAYFFYIEESCIQVSHKI